MLLWLATEFLVGLHDTFIQFHPYVTMLAIVIPVACSRLAISAKTEELNGKISFKQAFVTGAVIAVLSAVLMVGTQYVFHALIHSLEIQTINKIVLFKDVNNIIFKDVLNANILLLKKMEFALFLIVQKFNKLLKNALIVKMDII